MVKRRQWRALTGAPIGNRFAPEEEWRGFLLPGCGPGWRLARRAGLASLSLASGLLAAATAAPLRPVYDVVIYGGSSAGVIAAAQSAQLGKSTLLIAASEHLGGMTASGLGATDVGVAATIGGTARDFYTYVARYYRPTLSFAASPAALAGAFASVGPEAPPAVQFEFEPHAAEAVFLEMLRGAGADWIVGEPLARQSGVTRNGNRIVSIRTTTGLTIHGRIFIDATYEGDLLAAAGVSYRVGRESRSEFGESLAGIQRNPELAGEVDPYRVPQEPASGLLPRVQADDPGPDGTADNRVQQYNLRLCLTNVPANRIPIAQPPTYDRSNYELLARHLQQHPDETLNDVCKVQPLPGGKADINANGSFSTDMAGDESSRWVEAGDAERAAIQSAYRDYTQGLFWFLAHDPAVPRQIAAEAANWGLPKDEFTDNDHWPWQVYVREARRMIGSYLITQHDCEGDVVVSDPVALGSYALDSHKVSLFVDGRGQLNTEGFFYKPVDPYPISYRAIIPRAADCGNLLVPVCLSATHVAFNSIRMEPVFMMLGQAAATAASEAIDEDTSVQGINYAALARQLKGDGQILQWPNLPESTEVVALPSPPRFGQVER